MNLLLQFWAWHGMPCHAMVVNLGKLCHANPVLGSIFYAVPAIPAPLAYFPVYSSPPVHDVHRHEHVSCHALTSVRHAMTSVRHAMTS